MRIWQRRRRPTDGSPKITVDALAADALDSLDSVLTLLEKVADDGKSWPPPVTVKGGNAAFYSIGVTK